MKWMIAICLALAAAGGDPPDLRDNPAYRAWAGFKPGATVVLSTVTMQGAAKQADVETIVRLIEVTSDKVVVENSGSMEAGDSRMKLPAERQEIPAKIPAGKLPSGRVVEEAEETIEVTGKPLAVYRTRRVEDQGPIHTETTTWTSSRVPGGVVREIMVVQGKQKTVTRMELLRWDTPSPARDSAD
ncbi:MAG: hypothetical protein ACHRHE_13075 [Tepidisphaerales bacterium]